MNVYKNMSALKYIIMCVNNWDLFLSQKKENGVKKVLKYVTNNLSKRL